MRFCDVPLPEDWEDLPARWKDRIPQFEWSRLRESLRRAADIQTLITEASVKLAAVGLENNRLHEVAPVLDSIRRVRAVLDLPIGDRIDPGVLSRLWDAVNDMHLEMTVAIALANAETAKKTALKLDHWAARPEAERPEDIKASVREWLAGQREERLSQISLEDRAEVEAQDRANRGG